MKDYLHDKTIRNYVYVRDGGSCCYCGKPLTRNSATLDHYLPRTAGGPSTVYNLLLCCKVCNKEKGSETPDDWQQRLTGLFRRAVVDGMISQRDGKISLKEAAPLVQRLEGLSRLVVFQGGGMRISVDGHTAVSIVRIATEEE